MKTKQNGPDGQSTVTGTRRVPVNGLSPEAQAFYKRLLKEWNIGDVAGQTTALVAAQSLDRLREAQGILTKDGCIVTDRWGQQKAHPASTVEREARAGLLACLKSLNLDLESLGEVDDAETA